MDDETAGLVERLTRTEKVNDPFTLKPRLINPDGPEAAATLTAQAAEIARLKEGYRDAVGGLQYILMHHGRLSGVGFDRVFNTYRALTGSQSHD